MSEQKSNEILKITKEIREVQRSRYIDFKLDFSFRHFFAKENHLDLLKNFLNGVFEGRKIIREVKLGKTDRKGDQKNDRGTIKVAEVSNLTPAEMSTYQKELKRKRDIYSREKYLLEHGLEQGIKQGIEQGILKGKRKNAIETACKLLEKGMSIGEISEITGLSIKEIEAI